MNQKDNDLNFKKLIKNDSQVNLSNSKNTRDKIKLKIMHKFNVSSSEAEKILLELERKKNKSVVKKEISNTSINKKNSNFHNKDISKNDLKRSEENLIHSKQVLNKNNVIKQPKSKLESNSINGLSKNVINEQDERNSVKNNDFRVKYDSENQNNNLKYPNNQKVNVDSDEDNNLNTANRNRKVDLDSINTVNNFHNNSSSEKDVDSIIGDIMPDYNEQISICLSHVDLTFKVRDQRVDTLKERVIRFLKRNNAKKIKIHALKDISFKIYKGEKVGIIGYNGAGKSTLLNVIAGIYHPNNGNVVTSGNISPLLSLGAGFDHNFSGRRNIVLNGAVLGYSKEFLESKMNEIIEFSELGEYIDIPIKNYSAGMMAKLGFSIATAVEPDILIVDEILGVGDVNFRKKSGDKIRSLMGGKTTVLFVSHSIAQIRELCDKAIWIDNGNLREMGEVNKVCDNYLKDAEKASNGQLANIQLR